MRRITVVLAVAMLACGTCVVGAGAALAVGPATHGTLLAALNDPGGISGDNFSLNAVSVDGTTAVVGAQGTSFAKGAAYIYVKGRYGWPTSPTVTLQDPPQANSDIFGQSVAVSGKTIVVGAYGASSAQGAAYIYVKGRHGWPTTPTTTLADPAATSGDLFGASVAVSGNSAVIGAYEGTSPGGAAYIYVKGRHGWPTTPTATLADPAATAFDLFGASVAVSGKSAVVGAFNGNAAYIYVKGAHGWPTSPTTTLAAGTSGGAFGASVATADGTTIVGAPGGAAYIYVRGTHGWPTSPTTTLPEPTGSTSADFGVSVAVDGGTALVGDDIANSGNGAVYTYLRGAQGWPTSPTATRADPAAAPADDAFGESVAVETGTAIGGAWLTLGNTIVGGIGAAYIYKP